MKLALAAACMLLLLAVGYLSLSLVILAPPRANVPLWFAVAAVIAAQAVLTLVTLWMPTPPAPLRAAVIGGALVLMAIAIWRVRATLAGPHFEGYNLLLGAMLAVQAALTIVVEGRAALSHGAMH
ncbi:MAG TPA: hypothetical protein VKE51_31910 [Vicinamibacterales bacterium]|nr:hypothetical protein [Vicinamibacterales bacterium]